ncbi:MAG: SDR family oxidoreductase [Coriobacteriia bacterium]
MAADSRNGSFAGKTALVFGGSKGIGEATARILAASGARVFLVARGEADLERVAEDIRRIAGQETVLGYYACDATDEDSVDHLVSSFISSHGVPDYLLNVVGCAVPGYVQDLRLEDYRKAMETNFFGQLIPTLSVLPHMVERGSGHIAFTSSALGFMGVMGYATYAPTKYALVGLAEVLRNELQPKGLRFSVLFPPDTDTPGFAKENETKPAEWFATSASKLATPEQVASAFVDGLSRRRFYITPGQSSLLWRLARFAPRTLHWYADRELAAARKRLERA